MKLMYEALFEINSYHISCSLAKEIWSVRGYKGRFYTYTGLKTQAWALELVRLPSTGKWPTIASQNNCTEVALMCMSLILRILLTSNSVRYVFADNIRLNLEIKYKQMWWTVQRIMGLSLTHCIFKFFIYLNKLCIYLLYFLLLKHI